MEGDYVVGDTVIVKINLRITDLGISRCVYYLGLSAGSEKQRAGGSGGGDVSS
jgi:hypothetical protein